MTVHDHREFSVHGIPFPRFAERDELRRDVELLCMQEAGYAGAVDVMARMQARR